MVMRCKMLAFIVVLVFQTVIVPMTATAQTIEHEDGHPASSDNLDSEIQANVSAEDENPVEDATATDENEANMKDDAVELAPEVDEEVDRIDTNDDAAGEDLTIDEEVAEDVPDDPAAEMSSETNEQTEVNEEESIIEEKKERTETTSDVDENTPTQQASETHEAVDVGNIFTFDYFKKDDVDLVDGTGIEFNTEYQLQYTWDTVDLDVKAGDTATLALPDVFKQWPENTPAQDIKISGGTVVGKYTISGGFLQFIFNENIEKSSIHNGFVGLSIEFDQEKFVDNWEQEIDFDGDGIKDYKVVVKPKTVETKLLKEGHPDQAKNAKEITWSIEIINGSDEAMTNAMLTDTLPEGLGEPRNFVIKEITFDFDGKQKIGQEVDVSEPIIDDQAFKLTFDHVPARGGYKVEYTTTVTDYTMKEFTNHASFTNEDGELTANATVHTGERSNPIQKSGTYNWNTGQIDWTILVNENGLDMNHAKIHDTLPAELKLVDGSIKVMRNWQRVDNKEWTSFPITLGKVTTDEVYTIQFSTSIDWSKVNDGAYVHFHTFANEAELTDGEEPRGQAEAEVGFWRETLLSKSGNASAYTYDNKVLSWTLDVNKAKHPIDHAVVRDILPAGLDIKERDIVISDETDRVVEEKEITITPLDDGRTEVQINLGNIGTKTFKITYQTEVKDFHIDSFTNTASLDGDGIGKEHPKVDTSVTPPGNMYKKEYRDIDYNEKSIDWTITVDPKREAITELIIEDTFPNNGLILLPDSVMVQIGNKKLSQDTDYTLMPHTIDGVTGYNKGFIIHLINSSEDAPLNEQVTVDFKTSYDPQIEVEGNTLDEHRGDPTIFKNHARFTGKTVNGHEINEEDEAQTKVRIDSWNSGKKEGQLVHEDEGNLVAGWKSGYERKIAWQLYTNYQKQNLGPGVIITDTLDYEGTIDQDRIQVFVYKVHKNGETEITNQKVSPDLYDVNLDGKMFTLTFKEALSERYVVTFTTTVPDLSQAKYTNKAIVKMGEKEYPYSGTVNYDKWNIYLGKQALGQEGHEVFIGEELEWDVTVNENLSTIKDARITDTISAGLTYVDESLNITTGNGSELEQEKDYELTVVVVNENGDTQLTIDFKEKVTQALTLNYRTVVVATNGQQVNNKVKLQGIGFENKTVETERLTAKAFSWVGGELNPNLGAIKIQKVDAAGEVIQTGEATFELWFDLNGERVPLAEEFITTNGVLEIGNLPLRTYYLKEVEAPKGYVLSDKEIEIVVDKPYNNKEENIVKVDVENIAEVEIAVEKAWDDADNQDGIRPHSIIVNVLANEKIVDSTTLNAENDWSATFTGLSAMDTKGQDLVYTVEEEAVDGYETRIDGTPEDGFVITNKYTPETININGKKTWKDANNQDGKRPASITVRLLANGEEIEHTEVTAEDEWKYAFTDVPKFKNGEEIIYTVLEDQVENYATEINGFNMTNHYTPEQTSINVVKVWNDAENQDGIRPESITVKLLANGEATDRVVRLNDENNWQADFTELDVYAKGKEIAYTIEEVAVKGYETSISGSSKNGFVITNIHEPERMDVEGSKRWADANNQDGKRPASITVRLLANGEEIDYTEVTAEDEWKYAFTDVPKFKNGEEIFYTVLEDQVEHYATEIDGFNMTNSYTPEVLDLTVNKTWDDGDNQDGKRPDVITVHLLANGKVVERVEVTAENDWTHMFKGLPKFTNGEEIKYAVQELHVENYSTTIDGFEMTNSYTPGKTSVNVLKVWQDADNRDGKRPESIEVILLADGEATDQTLVLNEANNWQGDFIDLDEFKDGQEIKYSVEEVAVDEYHTAITGDPKTGFVITNTQKTYAIGDYTWLDRNKDGIQDENEEVLPGVMVELYDESAKNKLAETRTDEKGLYIFDELPAGKYTVKFTLTKEQAKKYRFTKQNEDEDATTDSDADPETGWTKVIVLNNDNKYVTTEYKDQNFKATEGIDPTWDAGVIELMDITITKHWEEKDSSIRPDAITVDLLANDDKVSEYEVTAESKWALTIEGLDKYDQNGEEMAYTIVEHMVSEYNPSIDGFDITNTRKTYAIGDYTWIDSNKDGIQDEDEEPLVAVTVELFDKDGNKIAETRTDVNGRYMFDELESGDYKVKFTLTEEQAKTYKFTKQDAGKDPTIDSDADKNAWTREISLNENNAYVTTDYKDQTFKATEGIDPTWDAGVIEIPEQPEEPKPEDPKPENPKPEDPKPENPKPEDPKPENQKPAAAKSELPKLEKVSENGTPTDANNKGRLPNTATNTHNYLLIGIGLLVLGGTARFICQRRKE